MRPCAMTFDKLAFPDRIYILTCEEYDRPQADGQEEIVGVYWSWAQGTEAALKAAREKGDSPKTRDWDLLEWVVAEQSYREFRSFRRAPLSVQGAHRTMNEWKQLPLDSQADGLWTLRDEGEVHGKDD